MESFTFGSRYREEFGLSSETLKLHAFILFGGEAMKNQRNRTTQQFTLAENDAAGLIRNCERRPAVIHRLRSPLGLLQGKLREAVQSARAEGLKSRLTLPDGRLRLDTSWRFKGESHAALIGKDKNALKTKTIGTTPALDFVVEPLCE